MLTAILRSVGLTGTKHSLSEYEIGDIYRKEVASRPRQRWPQWKITRLLVNPDGTPHAILILITDEKTTRRVAVATLRQNTQWQLYKKASAVRVN